ncbi:MAG: hypothetical protein Q4G05_01465 [Clostridia bacterium]|nr:hypothetical protein [Clostridia bacterium]
MRKKYTSKMYMRGVTDWESVTIKQKEKNYSIIIKRINDIEKPFIINNKPLIDKRILYNRMYTT